MNRLSYIATLVLLTCAICYGAGNTITSTNIVGTNGKFTNISAGSIHADNMVGDFTGSFTGTVNPTASMSGHLIGNVFGNLSGNVTGNLSGNVTGNVTGNINNILFSGQFASLNAAITAIGSAPTTLVVNTASFPVTGAVTIPSTLSINVILPGSINNSGTLTINGPFESGLHQVFAGSGSVNGLRTVIPEWFGAKGDGASDDTVALNKTYAALPTGGEVKLTGQYLVSSTINIASSYIKTTGISYSQSKIIGNSSGIGDVVYAGLPSGVMYGLEFHNVSIVSNVFTSRPTAALHIKQASEPIIKNIRVGGAVVAALDLDGVDIAHIDDLSVSGGATTDIGVYLTCAAGGALTGNTRININNANIFGCQTAAVMVDANLAGFKMIGSSWIEWTPYGFLISQPNGTPLTIASLSFDDVSMWNGPDLSASVSNGQFFHVQTSSASDSCYLLGLAFRNLYVYNRDSHYAFQIVAGSNANMSVNNMVIDGGVFQGSDTSVSTSDTSNLTLEQRGAINARVGYLTGATIPILQGFGAFVSTASSYGTWVPVDNSGASLALTSVAGDCRWTRNGNMVTASFSLTYPITADVSPANISGLPFPAINTTSNMYPVNVGFTTYTASALSGVVGSNQAIIIWNKSATATQPTNAELSGKEIRGVLVYETNP